MLLEKGYVESNIHGRGIITKVLTQVDRNKVVITVRSTDKGEKVLKAFPTGSNLSYTIVKDVGQEGAFDEVRPKRD